MNIQIPMKKMKKVSPQSLEGESGWQLREAYADAMKDMEKYADYYFSLGILLT